MNLITKEELNAIKMRIQKEFKNDDVEFSGCNRFVMREGYQTKVVGGDAILYRYILFNEKAEIIPLESEYNGIYQFSRHGLATVCTRKNFEIINNEKFRAEKKMGLIDTEGKEIIPCLYDSVSIKPEGLVVIKKAGELKSIPISVLLQNGVDWENMNPYS